MIVFQLKCPLDHRFDVWFRSGEDYEKQISVGLVACPYCGDTSITKAPMAPSLVKSRGSRKDEELHVDKKTPDDKASGTQISAAPHSSLPAKETTPTEEALASLVQAHALLQAIHTHVQKNYDDVGDRFAEEARRIHYGETETRPIHGKATPKEAEELEDEGISVTVLPALPQLN